MYTETIDWETNSPLDVRAAGMESSFLARSAPSLVTAVRTVVRIILERLTRHVARRDKVSNSSAVVVGGNYGVTKSDTKSRISRT